MKKYIVSAIVALSIISGACVTAKKKVSYEFPKEMAPNIQAEYTKICDKGQALYNMTCAKCHNMTVRNKTIIPDFTPEQIKGYEIRASNVQHETTMPDSLVTAEELGQISTFLMYKKKSGVPIK